ncbi:MAG: cyclic nucleotide-binding domain-containing protein [Pseudomarimonas sp.]
MSKDSPFVDFPAGAAIISEGEAASALFIIESGKVSIQRADAKGVVLAQLGPGDFFGEMSILQEQPHSSSVLAQEAVRALRVDVAAFHGLLAENIEIAVLLMRRLVLRLKASEQRRVELEMQISRLGVAMPAAAPAPAAAAPDAITERLSTLSGKSSGFALRTAEGLIPLLAGCEDYLVGRPDPATGAVPEVNLGPLDVARSLSRKHARLSIEDGALLLREEPGVGNGTWVNGGKLMPNETVLLQIGDSLRFGAVEVLVERA